MRTEDFLQELYDKGLKAYKKDRQKSARARKLDRHETITVDGTEVSCWRELVMLKVAQYMQETLPDADIRVVLSGNDSYINADLSDEEKVRLTGKLNSFLEKI